MSAPFMGPPKRTNEQTVVQRENIVFQDAYAKGRITQDEYNQAMGYQNSRLSDNVTPAVVEVTAWTKEYETSQTFYQEIGYPQYGGLYSAPTVPKDMTVQKVEQKDNQLLFTLAPKTTGVGSNALEIAKQQQLTRESYQLRSNTRQGTSPPNMTFIADPAANLSDQDKQAFNEWNAQRRRESTANLATFLVAGAIAPVLGPVGVAKSVAIGVGASQAIKTGATVWQGGDVSQSLLTPSETVQAAETGIIFAGIGGYASGALGLTGKSASTVVNVAKAGGRVGLSTSMGAGAGTVAEYVETGKVTGQGAIQGAAFGLAFGLGGESLGLVRQGGKAVLTRIDNVVRPQRAAESSLYNRAVVSDISKAPVGSKSWVETVKTKLTPQSYKEHLALQKVFSVNRPDESVLLGSFDAKTQADVFKVTTFDKKGGVFASKDLSPKEFKVESQGGAKQWTSQQLYQKPAQVQKTSLNKTFAPKMELTKKQPKSFLLTGLASVGAKSKVKVSKAQPKSIIEVQDKAGIQDTAMSIGRQQTEFTSTAQQQPKNPFTSPRGTPYYQTRERSDADDDVIATTYPSQSPLSQPKEIVKTGLLQGNYAKELTKATQGLKIDWGLGQKQGQTPIQKQSETTIQDQGLRQDYRTKTDVLSKQTSKQILKTNGFGLGGFSIGGFSSGSPMISRRHKQQTRVYPIVTGEQILKGLYVNRHKTKSKGKKKK